MNDKNWQTASGATISRLEELVSIAPFTLPESYISFLSKFDGGQWCLNVEPYWLCLDSAKEVIKTEQDGIFHESFSDFFVIGSNGAGEAIAFKIKAKGEAQVIYFDMSNIDITESVQPLASSFDELIKLIENSNS